MERGVLSGLKERPELLLLEDALEYPERDVLPYLGS